ncbi:MAG TPA: TonB-dependent receptor [Opitutaceae bacterium]|nr:TonB-dependent receptor [Opitutaceae bacterium]
MSLSFRLSSTAVLAVALSTFAFAAETDPSDAPPVRLDDYIVETNPATFDQKAPAVTQQALAIDFQGLNLATTAETLRNFPNLFIRERFIGDKNAPVGIRGTSNRQTGRTLVLADGVPLSNFLGTGFGNSPRWFLLAPEEIEKVAVIYGPFSALYAGNSIGGTVLFTTSMPTRLMAEAKGQYFYHEFREFGTDENLHGKTAFVSVGNKIGKFSYYTFYSRLDNESASTQFWTINNSATSAPGSGGTVVTGAKTDTDFSGNPRIIYGAEGPTEAIHNLFKAKLGYDLSPDLHLRYVLAYWDNEENRNAPETYLRNAAGNPVWVGKVEAANRTFTISPAQFGLSERNQADLVNALTLDFQPETGFQIVVVGSRYDALKDRQYTSTGALPAARESGPGQATIASDTGWQTLEVKLGYRADHHWLAAHAPAFGYHFDNYYTISNQYNLSDWRNPASITSLNSGNGGETRTQALYAQDVWSFAPDWTLTPGIRWEDWTACDGYREKDFAGSRVHTGYADRSSAALSPKLALAWKPAPGWNARLSFGEAYRFPTVGELFQGSVSANGSVTNNDPNLRAEHALDEDLTVERSLDRDSFVRLSLFQEDVRHALISQSAILPDGTSFTGTQNIGRIRTRGAELTFERKRFLADSVDVTVAISYTDARILENADLPASVGKQVPRIPYWQTRTALTWRPWRRLAISGQLRTSSHQFNTLDNSDPYGGYGGADSYTVLDLKATALLPHHLTASLGCDNVTDDRYHVYHPIEERTWFGEMTWRY